MSYLRDAAVLTDHAFGPHLPFVVTFRAPCQTLARHVWQPPIDKDEIASRYQSPGEWHARRLNTWSQACEAAVAHLLPASADSGDTPSSLPAQFTGRCRPPVFNRRQAPALVKLRADERPGATGPFCLTESSKKAWRMSAYLSV